MSAQHTPGPWQTMEVGDDIVRLAVADESGLSVLTVVTEGDAQFAAVYSEADARLIAAAPDLLEVLQKIVNHVDAGTAAILNRLVSEARAAIAKAEGGKA